MSMCSTLIAFVFPVAVTNMSPTFEASAIGITSKPSITASRALIGSTSVTMTLAPIPLNLLAMPLPTHPYPATTAIFPAIRMFVALSIPSMALCPVPYLLSKRYLVYALFTATRGYLRTPSFSIALSLITPVVVSSVPP
uniref:Uncharacterized protein ORF-c20_047 n=1 Tax=Saccharolobus solfataricus TaxID=2287 RepID=Q9UXE2_SACSO|nr:hypothetical protein [Saccharolobus solfataricus P2]